MAVGKRSNQDRCRKVPLTNDPQSLNPRPPVGKGAGLGSGIGNRVGRLNQPSVFKCV